MALKETARQVTRYGNRYRAHRVRAPDEVSTSDLGVGINELRKAKGTLERYLAREAAHEAAEAKRQAAPKMTNAEAIAQFSGGAV